MLAAFVATAAATVATAATAGTPAGPAAEVPPTPATAPAPSPAPGAARPAPAGVEGERRELGLLRRRLADLKARWEATRRKAADVQQSLAEAELNLEIRTAERREAELKTAESERAVAGARSGRDEARRQVDALRVDLNVRVGALYRMGRFGYLQTLVAADSGERFLRGLQLLSFLVRRDALLLRKYEEALAHLQLLERQLADQQQQLSVWARETRQRERALQLARAQQAALLGRVRQAEEEQRRAVTQLEDKTTRLAALLELLETRGRALPAGSASIRKFRGALDWPVRGAVVVPFGRIANPKFPKTFLRSTGWTIDAPVGTDVRAVFAGDVVFAQWLKGYGNLVVIDHGEGIFTLYGHLMTGTASRGTRVGVGERIGRVADPPEDEPGGLYFEVRDARASVDPREWLR